MYWLGPRSVATFLPVTRFQSLTSPALPLSPWYPPPPLARVLPSAAKARPPMEPRWPSRFGPGLMLAAGPPGARARAAPNASSRTRKRDMGVLPWIGPGPRTGVLYRWSSPHGHALPRPLAGEPVFLDECPNLMVFGVQRRPEETRNPC